MTKHRKTFEDFIKLLYPENLTVHQLYYGLEEELQELSTATEQGKILELADIFGYLTAISLRLGLPVFRDEAMEKILAAKYSLRQVAYEIGGLKRDGFRRPEKLGIAYIPEWKENFLLRLIVGDHTQIDVNKRSEELIQWNNNIRALLIIRAGEAESRKQHPGTRFLFYRNMQSLSPNEVQELFERNPL